jgi:tetratricopeptide (TPR) repeat protein
MKITNILLTIVIALLTTILILQLTISSRLKKVLLTQFEIKTALPRESAEDYFNKGMEHYDNMELGSAIVYFDKAIEQDPENVKAYYLAGCASSDLSKERDAIAYFTKALELPSKMEDILYSDRASSYEAIGDFEAAFEDYTAAIHYQPDKGSYYYFRAGIVYLKLNKPCEALPDYRKACELGFDEACHVINSPFFPECMDE